MRRFRVLLVLVVLGAITACGDDSSQDVSAAAGVESRSSTTDAATPPPEVAVPEDDVFLWLSADRVPLGPVEVVGALMNNTDADLTFGVTAQVERWDGEDWVLQGWLGMCLDHWHCTAELQPPGDGIGAPDIGLSPSLDSPGSMERFSTDGLSAGWYRISQTANEGAVAVGVLKITEDAEPLAPLVPVDEPAISIHPIVVRAEGEMVTLHPLIPAPSGSQSISDIEAAIEGLADTATLERWDDDRWVQVTEVALDPYAPGESSVGRSAAIPALDPGSYRLVRTGPAAPHTGNFWVRS